MMDTFFSSSEKRAMGTVLLTLVWPETTDSLVTDSLPSAYKEGKEGKAEDLLSAVPTNNQVKAETQTSEH